MANINDNLLVNGAKGKVGGQLAYRTRGGKTSIVKLPKYKDRPPTVKQSERRDRFTYAAMYAQGAIGSEKLKKKYQKKASGTVTAYNIAFKDYLHAPVVKKINISGYTGAPGSQIIIKAKDDFRVIAVKVKISDSTGSVVEEGNAIMDPMNRKHWIYTAMHENVNVAGSKITAVAFDIPNNKGILEISVE